jgi:hypothetical protein
MEEHMASWKSIKEKPQESGFYLARYENISFIDSFGMAFFQKEGNKITELSSGRETIFVGWITFGNPGKLVKWAEMPLEE